MWYPTPFLLFMRMHIVIGIHDPSHINHIFIFLNTFQEQIKIYLFLLKERDNYSWNKYNGKATNRPIS